MVCFSDDVKHLFEVRINGVWHKDTTIYTDREFHTLMDLYDWALPYNLSVHHFCVGASINPVVKEMPEIGIPVYELTQTRHTHVAEGLKLYYLGGSKSGVPITRRYFNFVLTEATDDVPVEILALVDGKQYKYLSAYKATPTTLEEASMYIRYHHRHCTPPPGHKFSLSIQDISEMTVGALIASTPKSRNQNDGVTLELNRVCTDERYHNVCSSIMAKALRIAKEMGYERVLVYTQPEESGGSLRALGFVHTGTVKGKKKGWNSSNRQRKMPDEKMAGDKLRWELRLVA